METETRRERRKRQSRELMRSLRQARRDEATAPFFLGPAVPAPAAAPAAPPPPPRIPVPCSIPECPEQDVHSSHNGRPVCSRHLGCLVNGTPLKSPQNAPETSSNSKAPNVRELTDEDIRVLATKIEARRKTADSDPFAPSWWINAGLDKADREQPFRLPDQATVLRMLREPPITCNGIATVPSIPGQGNLSLGSTFSIAEGHRSELDPTVRAEVIEEYRDALTHTDLSEADLYELLHAPIVSRVWNDAKKTVEERNANAD